MLANAQQSVRFTIKIIKSSSNMSSEWHLDDIKFMDAIREYRWLYDKSTKDFRNRLMRSIGPYLMFVMSM